MFDVNCPACERRQLVFASQVRGITNDERGIHVAYRCWCGAESTWTTGRRGAAAPAPAREPVAA